MSSLWWLAACRESDGPPIPSREAELPPPLLTEVFERDGFVVQQGSWSWLDYLDCCEVDGFCLFNNPSSPYGYVSVPPGPGQSAPDLDGGREFHLRRDEAIVVTLEAPPLARYFSFRSYLMTRPVEGMPDQRVFGSLGPSMHHLVMAEQRGAEIWGQPLAIVISADAGVEAQVRDGLVEAGHDPRTIHFDRIPEDVAHLGLDAVADRFSAAARVAVFEDPDAGAAYLADPGATVWRLTPTEPVEAPSSHRLAGLPVMGSGVDESAWEGALDALEAAVLERWAGRPALVLNAIGVAIDSIDCIASGSCGGDTNDRYYGVLPGSIVLPGDDRFLVLLGVNHQRTGKASYSNVSVDSRFHLLGVDAVDSDQMVGTASAHLPDHPQRDDLYAVTVARSCASHTEACLEVPLDCPGLAYEAALTISYRAYLEPSTGAAPLEDELLADRAVAFWPVPTALRSAPDVVRISGTGGRGWCDPPRWGPSSR